MRLAWGGILSSFLWPSMCWLCQALIPTTGCCDACKALLPWLDPGCRQCARPLAAAGLCGRCSLKSPAFQQTLIPFRYAYPVDDWIGALKFHEQLAFAEFFAACLWEQATAYYRGKDWPSLLIPIPLHASRLRQRGYNQALLLALALARLSHIPVARTSLIKHRLTPPQTALSRVARQSNLKQAFSLARSINATHIALIDDVFTTGATVQAVASLLQQHGVEHIDVWCVARAGSE